MPLPDRLAIGRVVALLAVAATGTDAFAQARSRATPQLRPPGATQSQPPREEQRDAAARELTDLRARAITGAAAAQAAEEVLLAADARIAALDGEIAQRVESGALQRERLGVILTALQRLARQAPVRLVVMPESALDAARTAMLLAAVVPPLETAAGAIRQELQQLAALRNSADAERQDAAAASGQLAAERSELDALVARREALSRTIEGDNDGATRRHAALGGAAKDVADLVARLETSREAPAAQPDALAAIAPSAPAGPQFGAARGQLLMPVRGQIVRKFGQAPTRDPRQRGIVVETRPGAQVVAPFAGRVVFMGPFRSYGRILILEHGEGYHTLIAGFGRIEASVGRWVTAGEPLGVAVQSETGNPSLYLELRHAGQPIDPVPWFAAPKERLRG